MLAGQVRIVWNQVIRRKIPAIWFVRAHDPAAVLLTAICRVADISVSQLAAGKLNERDSAKMTYAACKPAGAPLWLCDVRTSGSLLNALPQMESLFQDVFGVCDWTLRREEIVAVRRLADQSRILFHCPA